MLNWQSRALSSIAGGVTHDSWHVHHPIVFSHASGPYKWDVDEKKYVDFWMGHGSLLLGHAHPIITKAISQQLYKGTHLSGNHSLLIEWAEKIIKLVPSIDQVRFCSSGTEATLLAIRLARAYTNRKFIVRIDGHFHGWHDEALSSIYSSWPCGSHPNANKYVKMGDPEDANSIYNLLKNRKVAALILEPGGGSSGTLAYSKEYLHSIREITSKTQTLMIFDEVMSGFRYASGGVQELSGIIPNITTLSKILCGGFPGAAVGGSCEIMSAFEKSKENRVIHSGTFNGNPISAAAGLATLNIIENNTIQSELTNRTSYFVKLVNEAAENSHLDIRLFNQASIFHILIGALSNKIPIKPGKNALILTKKFHFLYEILRKNLLSVGIDMHFSHGWFSYAHTEEIINESLNKFKEVFDLLDKSQFTNIASINNV
jgi:glutamate-1-semialdehyde 2,1-aminomutase